MGHRHQQADAIGHQSLLGELGVRRHTNRALRRTI